jgi:glycosyltransferase involved in cell wall biosynthesis
MSDPAPLLVSVVVPVYRGAQTLRGVIEELAALTTPGTTPDGHPYVVLEVVPVWDNGPDDSDAVITELANAHAWVRPVWLSRNFGQHPATVAGIAASRGDWVVTMDEDGQHDPADIGRMLDTALRERVALVYADPVNKPPHSGFRNAASALTKRTVLPALTGRRAVPFHSLRLLHGEHARAVAAYCGPGVYLDIALTWIIGAVATCPVRLRVEGRDAAGYSLRRLVSHFWRLVLSSGNRPLRLVSGLGVVTASLGILYAIMLVVQRFVGATDVEGWTSLIVVVLIVGGLTLLSLGVIAEYVGLAAGMSMGRPLYVATSDAFARLRRGGDRT